MQTKQSERVPVLILGGGVVGLSAALLLLHHGVRPLLVERHPGTSIHPRSRGINARSGEIFRQLGLFETIRALGSALQPALGIFAGDNLTQVVERIPRRTPDASEARLGVGMGMESITPTPSARCTQDLLEPMLRAEAVQRGGDLRFETALESFVQDDDGVTAWIMDGRSGARTEVRADYLIAADGVKGATREQLGIGITGPGVLGHLLNVLLRIDLAEMVRGREPSQVLIEYGDRRALWLPIDNHARWGLHIVYRPEDGESPADFPPARCAAIARTALGGAADIEVLGVLPWQPSVQVAERLRAGRVFLAGDAAHQMPPWAGQGANSGIAEVHNLAWKLAAVLRGAASPDLLDTYDSERQPVGHFAAVKSGEAAASDGLPRIGGGGKPAAFETMGPMFIVGFGYVYGEKAQLGQPTPFDGRVGSRVPHAWVEDRGVRMSTLDLFGRDFVLVTHGDDWSEVACTSAHELGISLLVVPLGELGKAEAWVEQLRLRPGDAMLVRPDGFVAWRSTSTEDRARELEAALRHALGHAR